MLRAAAALKKLSRSLRPQLSSSLERERDRASEREREREREREKEREREVSRCRALLPVAPPVCCTTASVIYYCYYVCIGRVVGAGVASAAIR